MILLILVCSRMVYDIPTGGSQARKGLKAYVELCVQRLEKRQDDFEFALIALTEQRAVREGFARLNREGSGTAWAQGFLEALDGASRSVMISHPGVENLAFRSLDGIKLAGSGADRDPVAYPDLQMRTMRREISKGADQLVERIVVPVRAADASPVAFLTADVNLRGFCKSVLSEIGSGSDTLVLLVNGSDRKIWSNSDDLVFPAGQPEQREFERNRKVYLVESAAVPETDRRLYAAVSKPSEAAGFVGLVQSTASIAVIVLLIWSCEFALSRESKQLTA